MGELKNYRIFSIKIKLYELKNFDFWAKFFNISDFVKVDFFLDGFFGTKFVGVCVKKRNKGVSSNFVLSDKFGINFMFYYYNISINKIAVFGRKKKKYYSNF